MKPTIGRIVHYHTPEDHASPTERGVLHSKGPFAALVVALDGDDVLLDVHYPDGKRSHWAKQSPSDKPLPAHWNWPPRE